MDIATLKPLRGNLVFITFFLPICSNNVMAQLGTYVQVWSHRGSDNRSFYEDFDPPWGSSKTLSTDSTIEEDIRSVLTV